MDLYRTRRDFNSIRIAYRDKRNRLGEAVRLGGSAHRADAAAAVAADHPANSNGVSSLPLTDRSGAAAVAAATAAAAAAAAAAATVASPHQGSRHSSNSAAGGGAATRILQVQPAPRPLTPGRDKYQQQQQQQPVRLPRVGGNSGRAPVAMNGNRSQCDHGEADYSQPQQPPADHLSLSRAESARYAEAELETDRMPAAGNAEASYSCSVRLKKIAKLVASDDISKELLIKNLNYAVKVLECVYIDETRAPRQTGRNSATDWSPEGSPGGTRRESSARAAITVVTE